MEWNFNPLRYTQEQKEIISKNLADNIDEVISVFENALLDYQDCYQIGHGMCHVISIICSHRKEYRLWGNVIKLWFQPELFGIEKMDTIRIGANGFFRIRSRTIEEIIREKLDDYWFPLNLEGEINRRVTLKKAIKMLNEFRKEIRNE